MLNLLLPIAVAALAGTAYVVATSPKKGEMTPARQSVLDTALQSTADPDALRALAKVFRDEGLPLQAELLEKRAKLRELPADVKEGRKAAFRAGMASTNSGAVRALANEFESEGATGAAAALRLHAFELDNPQASNPGAGLGLPNQGDIAAQVAQQAADLARRQEAIPDPADSPEAAAAMAAALEAASSPEAAALSNIFNPDGV